MTWLDVAHVDLCSDVSRVKGAVLCVLPLL